MSRSLHKSDGCGKNNDCSALGPGLRYFESHEPPLVVEGRVWHQFLFERARLDTLTAFVGSVPMEGCFLKVRPQRSMFDPVPLIRFTAASSRGKQHADLF